MQKLLQWSLPGSVLLSAIAIAELPYGPISGDAEAGKQLYFDHGCYGCHGYQGIGRRDLANDASGIMLNEQVFLIYLRARADKSPEFPTQDMPNYPASSLPDVAAKDIYAYIRTFRDEPPEIEDIPALQGVLDDARSD